MPQPVEILEVLCVPRHVDQGVDLVRGDLDYVDALGQQRGHDRRLEIVLDADAFAALRMERRQP